MASSPQDRRQLGGPKPQPRPRPAYWMILLALLALLLAMGWVLWRAAREGRYGGRGGLPPLVRLAREIGPGGRVPGDPYIGSRVCAECHPGEYALFTRSGHALTFRAASDRRLTEELAGVSVADPEHPAVRWTYEKPDGQFQIDREEAGKIEKFVVDYALGSGHHATTFVTVLNLDPLRVFEHRLTHYTREGTLGITPGQAAHEEKPGNRPDGCELSVQESRKCLNCHVTQLSASDPAAFDPTTVIPAVTCERCHGPGRAHVEVARRGADESELSLPMGPGRWTVQSQLELCGRCHRHPSRVPPSQLNPDDPFLARFQPVGLSQSRCFKATSSSLSCVSCHDPHARASSDMAGYERVCVGCHRLSPAQPALEAGKASSDSASRGSICPVSPSTGCVPCHMPRVDSGQHVLFTDHWIRVRPHATAAGPGSEP
jgi:hypothetical protein